MKKPTIDGLKKSADASVSPDALRRILKRRSLSLDAIALKLAITRGRALDLCDELKSEGVNIHVFNEQYSILRSPAPVAETAIHKLVSDKDGRYKFGALGDSHLCSKYERLDVLNDLYDMYESEGITRVYHCGNWIDGEARFNKFDIHVHGMQNQLRYFVENYPQRKGVTTYYVAGDDHEGWYCQREGVDIGRMLQDEAERAGRMDLKYLGYMEANISLIHKPTGNESKMLVSHPGGGSAYAISYAPQKIIESFQGGEKPAVLLLGHFHKMSFEHIRNVWCIQVGCQKDLDPFGRKKRITYHVGGVAVALWQDSNGAITDCQPRFKQYFDRGYTNNNWSLSGTVNKR